MNGRKHIDEDAFIRQRQPAWQTLDGFLTAKNQIHALPPQELTAFSQHYRTVCSDLMFARTAGYTRSLIAYLDALAGRAHNALYGAQPYRIQAIIDLVRVGFPATLRKNWRFFALASLLFIGPLLFSLVATLAMPAFATAILPDAMLDTLAEAYAEEAAGRDFGSDAAMAGFYVYNNIGIAFRCFATGIFLGLGSGFFLVYNGLNIGTFLGVVIGKGYGQHALTFMCGHGTFELTAIVIAGAAGLKMGYALVDTGGQTRLTSLRSQAGELGYLIMGAALMLAIAAVIEGFWSPSAVLAEIKWITAGVFAMLITLYVVFSGRSSQRSFLASKGSKRLS